MSKFDYNCTKCAAFCCIALQFKQEDHFPYDKEKDVPCKHLDDCFSCTVHTELSERGYQGCIDFSCHGAGPHLTQLYAKEDWQSNPEKTQEVYEKFHFLRAVFEIAETTETVLKKNKIKSKPLIIDFFRMVGTAQKVPSVEDYAACNAFTEEWTRKTRDFIAKNT